MSNLRRSNYGLFIVFILILDAMPLAANPVTPEEELWTMGGALLIGIVIAVMAVVFSIKWLRRARNKNGNSN
jgi:hypothetical protein